MYRIITFFCAAWALYCLVITGHQVLTGINLTGLIQTEATDRQNNTGDLHNRGARLAVALQPDRPPRAAVYSETDGLRALAFNYWLYPTEIIPYDDNPAETIFKQPPQPVVYFIGRQSTYQRLAPLVPQRFASHSLIQDNGQVFAIIEEREAGDD